MKYRYNLNLTGEDGRRVSFSGPDIDELYHQMPDLLAALGLSVEDDRYTAIDPPQDAPDHEPEGPEARSKEEGSANLTYGVCPIHHTPYDHIIIGNVPYHIEHRLQCWGKRLTTSQLSALKGE